MVSFTKPKLSRSDESYRQLSIASSGLKQSLLDAVVEEVTVGQACQGVEVRQVQETGFCTLALGYVAGQGVHRRDARFGRCPDAGGKIFDPQHLSGSRNQPVLVGPRLLVTQRKTPRCEGVPVVRVEGDRQTGIEQMRTGIAGHRGAGLAGPHHRHLVVLLDEVAVAEPAAVALNPGRQGLPHLERHQGVDALGHVALNGYQMGNPARDTPKRIVLLLVPEQGPIGPVVAQNDGARRPLSNRLAQQLVALLFGVVALKKA